MGLISRKNSTFLVLCILGLIVFIGAIIYHLNSPNFKPQENVSNLKDYDSLKQTINELNSDPAIAKDGFYSETLHRLSILDDKNASDEAKIASIAKGASTLSYLYSDVHNPKVREAFNQLKSFTKGNFPKYYQERYFIIYCQDTTCQDTPQPPEILKIVDEINSSSIADYAKKTYVNNLLNAGYVSKNDIDAKVYSYYIISLYIRNDGEFSKAGINDKIADEVYNYLSNTYPTVVENLKLKRIFQPSS